MVSIVQDLKNTYQSVLKFHLAYLSKRVSAPESTTEDEISDLEQASDYRGNETEVAYERVRSYVKRRRR